MLFLINNPLTHTHTHTHKILHIPLTAKYGDFIESTYCNQNLLSETVVKSFYFSSGPVALIQAQNFRFVRAYDSKYISVHLFCIYTPI